MRVDEVSFESIVESLPTSGVAQLAASSPRWRERLRGALAGPLARLSRAAAGAAAAEDPGAHRAELAAARAEVEALLAAEVESLAARAAELRREREARAFARPERESDRIAHELRVDRAVRRLESMSPSEREAVVADAAIRGRGDGRLLVEAALAIGAETGREFQSLDLAREALLARELPAETAALAEVEATRAAAEVLAATAAGVAGGLVGGAETELRREPTFAARVRAALAPPAEPGPPAD